MIDSHIHADTRPYEDFEMMAISGIREAVSCAHDPLAMTSSDVVFDHFNRLLTNDRKRGQENGLKIHIALGIHPRGIPSDYVRALEMLPEFIENPAVVAMGELGLDSGSEIEKKVFSAQLRIADETGFRAIVHTPRNSKSIITPQILGIIREHFDEGNVIIEHVNMEVIPLLIETDCLLGLTVQPEKMSPSEAVSILQEYGCDKFVLNSDMSSSPSDPLSVPKTVHRMRLSGFSESDIKKVSERNVRRFLKI